MELNEHLAKAREIAAEANKGNTNSSKNNRLWADTLKRALLQADGNKIRAIAEALIEKAASGDVSAIRELGDRVDGKPTQQIDQTTEHSGEVTYTWKK
ncbi:hypothetical protein UFOVP770_54 [uncultured Caudovirales phage]|uniref:Uncharacterized protein n=1 Tax=uncultured Caudovirales phage TaxID=2100421 RepID=A0A6J5NVC6_9CAUD|nr:hypothetical protein UFOVP770_54 [uncultured Caudovirales phage]